MCVCVCVCVYACVSGTCNFASFCVSDVVVCMCGYASSCVCGRPWRACLMRAIFDSALRRGIRRVPRRARACSLRTPPQAGKRRTTTSVTTLHAPDPGLWRWTVSRRRVPVTRTITGA